MSKSALLGYAADILSKSGGVGLVTAFVFFICLGLGLERLVFWGRFWGVFRLSGLARHGKDEAATEEIESLLRRGQFKSAGCAAERSNNPVLRLLGSALSKLRHRDAWSNTRDRVLNESLASNVALGRRFLMTAIQGFGLLGMLGTCKGLYAQLSGFGSVAADAAALQGAMGGMGEAFTTTLVGLTAAGLTTIIYVANEIAVDRFTRHLRGADARIQAALKEAQGGAS